MKYVCKFRSFAIHLDYYCENDLLYESHKHRLVFLAKKFNYW